MGNVYRAFKSEKLPKNYFRFPVNCLRKLGIELMHDETLLYSIFSKSLLISTSITIIIVESYEVVMQWPDMDVIIAILNYLITHISGCAKVFILHKNRRSIGNMLKSLHHPPFFPNDFRTEGETKLVRNLVRKTEIQVIMYISLVVGSISSGIFKFFFSWIFMKKEARMLPYVPAMSFFDYTESPYFQLGGIYHSFVVAYLAALIASSYVLLTTILAHISIQMVLVANGFRHLKVRAEVLRAKDPDKEIDYYMKAVFKETISHHLKIFGLAEEMERLCSIMILMVFLTSCALLCFLLYYTFSMPLFSVPFIQHILYCTIIMCHVGMYCFWGDAVSEAAEDVARAAADAEWYGVSNDVAKSLIMVMIRAQRPLYMTAGKFVPLSLTTFVSVVKGSFSYFMILRQTNEST